MGGGGVETCPPIKAPTESKTANQGPGLRPHAASKLDNRSKWPISPEYIYTTIMTSTKKYFCWKWEKNAKMRAFYQVQRIAVDVAEAEERGRTTHAPPFLTVRINGEKVRAKYPNF